VHRAVSINLPMWSIDLIRRRWRPQAQGSINSFIAQAAVQPQRGDRREDDQGDPNRAIPRAREDADRLIITREESAKQRAERLRRENLVASAICPELVEEEDQRKTHAHHGELDAALDETAPRAAEEDAGGAVHFIGPPILLFTMQHNVQVVARCCEHAMMRGVKTGGGMTLAHARALIEHPDIHIEEFNAMRDAEELRKLAAWATRYSPLVSPDPPDGLLIDISGCARYFGGEFKLLRRMIRDLNRLGFYARAASASTFGCAWAAARFAVHDNGVIPPGQEQFFLAPLPIEALRLNEQIIEALHEVEITIIGHLFNLPRHQLTSRYSEEVLLRMDQAVGGAIETIEPVRPRSPLANSHEFDGPVLQLEGIEITIRDLLDELCAALVRQERGVRKLDLELLRIDAEPVWTAITLSRASRNAKHLWTLLWPRVEKMNLGFGVERITLTAARTAKLAHQQYQCDIAHRDAHPPGLQSGGVGLNSTSEHIDRAAGELIDTLAARFGADRVLRLQPRESHMPEHAFRYRSAMQERSHREISAGITVADRPTILLTRPELVAMEMVDSSPMRFRWRCFESAVMKWIGPERIADEWWNRNPRGPVRDYFKVQDERGRWLWMFREPQAGGRWFAHGVWT
jgi:protein ImuB